MCLDAAKVRYWEKTVEEGDEPEDLETIFREAQNQLKFSNREDFRLLVDFPLCHSVSQSVPFPENQLAQVLENYLEEELPYDIEDYSFDYKVLASKGTNSSVLGFWIQRQVLKAWTQLADELSLNSIDIQPAEMALLDEISEQPSLILTTDFDGNLRYCSLMQLGVMPNFVLGSIPSHQIDVESVAKILRFSVSNWEGVSSIRLSKELKSLEGMKDTLQVQSFEVIDDENFCDPFSHYATGGKAELKNLSFNYRKGDFAQRGLEERILWPVVLLAICLIGTLGVMSWQKYQLKLREKQKLVLLKRQKMEIWKKLYPGQKFPPSRTLNRMQANYKEATGTTGKGKDDNEKTSSLQILGKLFTYIKPDDEVLIERVTISKRSVTMRGHAPDAERAYRLGEGFKNQSEFKTPNLSVTFKEKKGVNDFKFNTMLIKKEDQKK